MDRYTSPMRCVRCMTWELWKQVNRSAGNEQLPRDELNGHAPATLGICSQRYTSTVCRVQWEQGAPVRCGKHYGLLGPLWNVIRVLKG